MRSSALGWWNSLSTSQKEDYIRRWKNITKNTKGSWEPIMISTSSACIELLWKEMTQYESTLDDSEG